MSATSIAIAREWQLVSRPGGRSSRSNFQLVKTTVPKPDAGQVVVRNTFLSVDPYMRGRMDDRPSYIPPFELGVPLDGAAIGVVIESRADGLEPGDVVEHFLGLREVAVADAGCFTPLELQGVAPEAFLGVLGGPGLTAWLGLVDIAPLRGGDAVFVSGAAGAVGSLAGQMARLRGAGRVVGSAGSAAKVAHLRDELGFDAGFNYHDGPVADQLAEVAPDGIDVFFDNVGGQQLEAAIGAMNVGGRLALCGALSQYDDGPVHAPRNMYDLVTKRLSARGFLVSDSLDRMPDFRAEVGRWVREGNVVHRETVVEGIESVPDALLGLLRAGAPGVGKVVVAVGEGA